MSLGNISSFDNVQSSFGISGTLHKLNAPGNDILKDIAKKTVTKWKYGSAAADTINQIAQVIFTATKNATTSLDFSGVLTNSIGDLLATYSRITKLTIEYLTVAQDATYGTASTGTVTIAPGGTHPVTTSPLGAAQTYAMKPGDVWCIEKHDAAGITITGGTADTFDFVHGDTSADAAFRITIFGDK